MYDPSANALFRYGPNVHMNACVGDNGGPYDLEDYGQGFFDGGRAVVAAARSGSIPSDIAVYPAAFAFRHGIELYLKCFHRELAIFLRQDTCMRKNHSIRDYMRRVIELLAATQEKIADPVTVGVVEDIVADFDQIDPSGQVFRYPEDIKGNAHLADIRIINLEVLDDGMTVFRDMVETWIWHLRDLQAHNDEWINNNG